MSEAFLKLCDHIDFMRYPIDHSLELFGKKWMGPVLIELLNGHDRFNLILGTIPGLNPRSLSARLDDLEAAGIIRRECDESGLVKVRYQLTQKGEDMRQVLRELVAFSLKWYATNIPSP